MKSTPVSSPLHLSQQSAYVCHRTLVVITIICCHNYNLISLEAVANAIVPTDFLLILNQTEIRLDHHQNKICQYRSYTLFSSKETKIKFWAQEQKCSDEKQLFLMRFCFPWLYLSLVISFVSRSYICQHLKYTSTDMMNSGDEGQGLS